MSLRPLFIFAVLMLLGAAVITKAAAAGEAIQYLFDESALGVQPQHKPAESAKKPQPKAAPKELPKEAVKETTKPQCQTAAPALPELPDLPVLPDLKRSKDKDSTAAKAENFHEKQSISAYTLSAGDELDITVYNEPSLSGKHKIDSDDLISLPLIGDIKVSGMSAADLERRIEEDLAQGYLVKPSVSIQVLTYRPFYILGEVLNPGSYDYVSGITVLKAVALAGGFTYRAEEDEVKILRKQGAGNDEYKEYPVQTKVMPGDIILVEEDFF